MIMCTMKARPQDIARGSELGCEGYVSKPFGPRELADKARWSVRVYRSGWDRWALASS